jgi:hypothetical protein
VEGKSNERRKGIEGIGKKEVDKENAMGVFNQ